MPPARRSKKAAAAARKPVAKRSKARARRVPSPTPPTLTPPATGRRGRPPGAGTYTNAELRLLLKCIRRCEPRTNSDWVQVENLYNKSFPADRHRRSDNLKARFNRLVRHPKPTGDPEANELHEEALLINEELEGLEHTHVLDDSPVPEASDAGTIDLETSDSDLEVLDVPEPPTSHVVRTAARAKSKVEPSSKFRAVARKTGSSSRPAQSQGFLDTATAQIASIFNPAAEDRIADRNREDLTMMNLHDTIRDLRAELSQERERRFALEQARRDADMRHQVEQQVQQQLRQRFPTHQTDAPMDSYPPRSRLTHYSDPCSSTAGNAHSSSMPGPPPSRTDASGSGGM
ncbi:hypothetical protein FRC09_017168 [Ceratobasidium sp. 395]|nr:hypothetical protein FRC09_017168 [Ceratobasidium sp. 395]